LKDINLLPDEIRMETSERKPKKSISIGVIVGLIAVVIILIASLAIPNVYLKVLDASISSLESDIQSVEFQQVRKLDEQINIVNTSIKTKTDIISHLDAQAKPIGQILNIIEKSVIKGCSINSIKYDTSSLSISGTAPSSVEAGEIITSMDRSGFKGLIDNMKNISYEKAGTAVEFSLRIDFQGKEGK